MDAYNTRRPFAPLPDQQPGLLQSLLRRASPDAAATAVNNLLASAADVRDVSPLDVLRICEQHRVELSTIAPRLERLYRDYLVFCLADGHLSERELCDLAHLKAVLRISDRSAAAMQQAAADVVYRRSVDDVLGDGGVDARERAFLRELQHELGIPAAGAARIEERRARSLQHAR